VISISRLSCVRSRQQRSRAVRGRNTTRREGQNPVERNVLLIPSVIVAATATMYRFALDVPVDVEELRERLRKMSDEQLRPFGRAARFMCSPAANRGKPPRECFVIQLEEAKTEWRRRNPVNADLERCTR
jgi:hypothetical protein